MIQEFAGIDLEHRPGGDEVEEVTPDPIITCPKCGCRYRAHKKK